MIDIVKAEKEFKKYLKNYDNNDDRVKLKTVHTYGVVKASEFLAKELKLDDYTYEKLPDYIKKCNDHKHKKEKWLGIESVINYLKVYYSLINYYIDYIKHYLQ